MSVSYTAVLPVRESTVLLVSGLLAAEQRRRRTRRRRRALGCYRQAVLLLRWFIYGTRRLQLPPTTPSAARRPTAICTRASTSSPQQRPGYAGRCWPPAPPAIRTSPWRARRSAPTGSAFPVRPHAAT